MIVIMRQSERVPRIHPVHAHAHVNDTSQTEYLEASINWIKSHRKELWIITKSKYAMQMEDREKTFSKCFLTKYALHSLVHCRLFIVPIKLDVSK